MSKVWTWAWCIAALLLAAAAFFTYPRANDEPHKPMTAFTNVAPCYSGMCLLSCPNRQHGIACSTSGQGNYCSPSIACRGIVLCK